MAPRAGQVAEVKLRDADHSLAAQPIVRVGPLRGQRMEPFAPVRERRDADRLRLDKPTGPTAPATDTRRRQGSPQSQGPLCRLCRSRGRQHPYHKQRCSHCGVELHLVARIPARSGPRVASARSARPRHSSSSDKRIQKGDRKEVVSAPLYIVHVGMNSGSEIVRVRTRRAARRRTRARRIRRSRRAAAAIR
jgi:hypothetical protein